MLCDFPAVIDIAYLILLFDPFRVRYLTPLLETTVHWDLYCRQSYFFLGSNTYIVRKNAKFIDKAVQIKTYYVEQIGVSSKADVFV